jgi:hypothetical protein
MAPEQLQGLDITPAVDLWALGATLYDAVAGRNPFERQTTAATFHAILMADLPSAPCGPPLAPVITGLLVRDPAQRMSTQQARALLTGPAVPPPPGPPTSPGQVRAPGPGRTAVATSPGNTWALGPEGTPVATSPTGSPPGPSAGRPPGWRRAVLAGAGAVVVVAAAAVTAVTLLHGSGGNGTAASGSSAGTSLSASTGTGDTPASSAPASPAPASSAPASGSAPSAVPPAYLGHWRGTLIENNGFQGPQTADLKLTGGSVNAIVGASSYTSGGCAYNLRLVSSDTSKVELHEEVTAGACEADYAIVAVKDGKLTENVYVISPDDPPNFTGTLAKS